MQQVTTTLRLETYDLRAAALGVENPLPIFRDPNADMPVRTDASVPAEDRRQLGWQTAHRILPYRMQDGYDREKKLRAFAAVVLENEILRATFLPELGGRLVSLRHKPTDHELLERNPVFQPANLALRNAWFSGGIEWNTGQFGHHYLTCSPIFAACVDSPDGYPVLRLYEWDRVKCFPWQIDFHLPPGASFLFARVRLLNPHDHELPMYWWTNIAVPEAEDVRVLAPAATALRGGGGAPLSLVSLAPDGSYPTRMPFAQELYFRIPENRRPWIAALDPHGTGLVHTSTRRLRGRKMFAWGMNAGGRHWQEYLSEPGRAYLEIQAGLTRTQLESIPMPAGAEWTWTEAFGRLEGVTSVESALDACLSEPQLDELHGRFDQVTRQRPAAILAQGSGWGALERRRQPSRLLVELVFADSTLGELQAPWLALLETGELPLHEPGAWMVQPEWQQLLETARSDHWLHWLHLGNMRMENGDAPGAVAAWRRSLDRQRTGGALRNLAVAEQQAGNLNVACDRLHEAWQTGPQMLALAIEYANLLVKCERSADLTAFVGGLPAAIRDHERIQIPAATAALRQGRRADVEKVLQREFVTIRESETALTDLWFAVHGRQTPPPAHLDFRMAQGPTSG